MKVRDVPDPTIQWSTDAVGRHLPLDAAPEAYATFREKGDGMVKVDFTT